MSDEVVRRLSNPPAWTGETGTPAAAAASPSPRQLDDLVDLVVERIEQRVIDELERRGRRGTGAF